MNLYLVLALALGVTAPLPAPRVNTVVAEARVQCRCAVSSTVRRSPLAVKTRHGQQPTTNGQRFEAPLTGAASPRAPASRC
jgi:hypothetical protein